MNTSWVTSSRSRVDTPNRRSVNQTYSNSRSKSSAKSGFSAAKAEERLAALGPFITGNWGGEGNPSRNSPGKPGPDDRRVRRRPPCGHSVDLQRDARQRGEKIDLDPRKDGAIQGQLQSASRSRGRVQPIVHVRLSDMHSLPAQRSERADGADEKGARMNAWRDRPHPQRRVDLCAARYGGGAREIAAPFEGHR